MSEKIKVIMAGAGGRMGATKKGTRASMALAHSAGSCL
jgi:hypothetical protein